MKKHHLYFITNKHIMQMQHMDKQPKCTVYSTAQVLVILVVHCLHWIKDGQPLHLLFIFHAQCISSMHGHKDKRCICYTNRPTFDGDHMLPDLILQGHVIDALDQVVYRVNVRVDGLEAVDLGSDGRRVGQHELRARRAGLRRGARYGSRAELTRPGAPGRARSELGRYGLGHRRGHRARGGHGGLGLLGNTGH